MPSSPSEQVIVPFSGSVSDGQGTVAQHNNNNNNPQCLITFNV